MKSYSYAANLKKCRNGTLDVQFWKGLAKTDTMV